MTVGLIFLILALVCFIAAAANAPVPHVNFVGLGLAFWVLTLIIGKA